MNFIRNRNFRAGPQTSLEGFLCPQNSDKQQKIKAFGRSVVYGMFTLELYNDAKNIYFLYRRLIYV